MTINELREIIESQGLAGMTASVYTKSRIYMGRVERINVTTLILTDPKVIFFSAGANATVSMQSIAGVSSEEVSEPALHKHIAVSVDHIEAISY